MLAVARTNARQETKSIPPVKNKRSDGFAPDKTTRSVVAQRIRDTILVGRLSLKSEMLMLKETYSYTYDYECSILKGIATVDTFGFTNAGAVITPETADPRLPFNATGHQMICRNRDECGIRRGEINGAPVYAWELCPAHRIFAETHSLPTTERNSSGSE
jgi:hypothetical protein